MDLENQSAVEMSITNSQDNVSNSEDMETDNIDSNKDISKQSNTVLKHCSKKDETTKETFKLELSTQELIYCPEYSEDIMHAWTHLQTRPCFLLPAEFLSKTKIPIVIFKEMRVKLMDWLISLQLYLKLSNEAIQLTINIIDRFTVCSPSCITKANYQLIGIAALSISSKFEEIVFADFGTLCDLTENAYSKQQLAVMEKEIYFSLDCCISNPQPIHFLRFFSILLRRDQMEHTLAKYLLELSLLQAEAAHLLPSLRATVCLSLASRLLGDNRDVMPKLARLLQVELNVLGKHEQVLIVEVRRVSSEKGAGLFVCQKYADKKFSCVSSLKCLTQL